VRPEQLEVLLADVAAGRLSPTAAIERLRHLPFEDLDFARIDHHRVLRQGHPEVVFCEGKTVEQVVAICDRLLHNAHKIDLKGPSKRRTKTDPKP